MPRSEPAKDGLPGVQTYKVAKSDLQDLFDEALAVIDALQPVEEVRAGQIESDPDGEPMANLEFVGVVSTTGRSHAPVVNEPPPPQTPRQLSRRSAHVDTLLEELQHDEDSAEHPLMLPPEPWPQNADEQQQQTAPPPYLRAVAPTVPARAPSAPQTPAVQATAARPSPPAGAHVEVSVGNTLGVLLGVAALGIGSVTALVIAYWLS